MPTNETMPSRFAPRRRKVRILATLGPASDSPAMIRALAEAGADAFRLNMSHGDHEDHLAADRGDPGPRKRARTADDDPRRPAGPQAARRQVQGRQGRAGGRTQPSPSTATTGRATRSASTFPIARFSRRSKPGARLLVDDGKLVFRVVKADEQRIETEVEVGGTISNNKGAQRPRRHAAARRDDRKDRADLAFALDHGRRLDRACRSSSGPEDVAEARRLIGGKAALLAKIEKPAAIERLEEILELADAVMVARGDLGVELPPEAVPPLQKRIVEAARRLGKPVVVATQMLESMISAPTPTRAEVSDVATAVYDGADAIMLSAESASGDFPREAVAMMDRIAASVEADPTHYARVHFTETLPDATTNDAIARGAAEMARTVGASAIVCFTSSGSTARRVARERPTVAAARADAATGDGAAARPAVGRARGQDPRRASFEEMVGKSQAHGAAPRSRQRRRADHRHRRRAVRRARIDQCRPRRPADRRRARQAPG